MRLDYKEWYDNLSDELQEEYDNLCIQNDLTLIDEVEMGCYNREHQYRVYMMREDAKSLYAQLYKFKEYYILLEDIDNSYYEESIYTDKEEALDALKKLEWSQYDTIEKEILDFHKELAEYSSNLTVEVVSTRNDFFAYKVIIGGHFVGMYQRTLYAEDYEDALRMYSELIRICGPEDICIEKFDFEKDRGDIYYNIELSHYDLSDYVDIELKSTDKIDIKYIKEQMELNNDNEVR